MATQVIRERDALESRSIAQAETHSSIEHLLGN